MSNCYLRFLLAVGARRARGSNKLSSHVWFSSGSASGRTCYYRRAAVSAPRCVSARGERHLPRPRLSWRGPKCTHAHDSPLRPSGRRSTAADAATRLRLWRGPSWRGASRPRRTRPSTSRSRWSGARSARHEQQHQHLTLYTPEVAGTLWLGDCS